VFPIQPIPGFADPVSSATHLAAAIYFAILTIRLVRSGRIHGGRLGTLLIFAVAVVLMFTMSGIYHLLDRGTEARVVLQRLDHASIFVLIAASFTAPHGILFRGLMRWGIIALVWTIAAVAIPLKTIYFDEMSERAGLVCYLGFGWIGLFSGLAVRHHFGTRFMAPLLWGALAYTGGAVVDYARWPNPIPGAVHAHELFHLCVIAGVAFHWHFCAHVVTSERVTPMDLDEALTEIGQTFAEVASVGTSAK